MVRMEFVQPVGTKEVAKRILVPRHSICSITSKAANLETEKQKSKSEFTRVTVKYQDGDTTTSVRGVMFLTEFKRIENLLMKANMEGTPLPPMSEQQLAAAAKLHVELHQAMESDIQPVWPPGKEDAPPEEIEALLSDREKQVEAQLRWRSAMKFINWLMETNRSIVEFDEDGESTIQLHDDLAHEYAQGAV